MNKRAVISGSNAGTGANRAEQGQSGRLSRMQPTQGSQTQKRESTNGRNFAALLRNWKSGDRREKPKRGAEVSSNGGIRGKAERSVRRGSN